MDWERAATSFCVCFHNYRCHFAWFTRFQLTPESYKIAFIWINDFETGVSNQEKHPEPIKYSRSFWKRGWFVLFFLLRCNFICIIFTARPFLLFRGPIQMSCFLTWWDAGWEIEEKLYLCFSESLKVFFHLHLQ